MGFTLLLKLVSKMFRRKIIAGDGKESPQWLSVLQMTHSRDGLTGLQEPTRKLFKTGSDRNLF